VPTIYYSILFWLYWGIALIFGVLLMTALFKEKDWGKQATAILILVPVVLRLLLIK